MKTEKKLLIAMIFSIVLLLVGAYLVGSSKTVPTIEALARTCIAIGVTGGAWSFVGWLVNLK